MRSDERRFYLYSVGVHALVLGFLVAQVWFYRPPRRYGIDFFSRGTGFGPGEGGGAPRLTKVAKPKAEPRPTAPPKPPKAAPKSDPKKVRIAENQPKKAEKKVTPPTETAPKTDSASKPSASAGSKTGRADSDGLGGTGPGTGMGSGIGIQVGGFGTGGGSGGVPFPYQWYVNLLYRKLWNSWEGKSQKGYSCDVAFVINADGSVNDIDVVEASGDSIFDFQGRRAVEVSAPFPPLPEGFSGDSLPVRVRFRIE